MGKSEIGFVYNGDDSIETDYVDFGVNIFSAKYSYNWSKYNAEEMIFSKNNNNNYNAYISHKDSGTGKNSYFRLRYEKGKGGISGIQIEIDDKKIFQRYGDKFTLIMPGICPWARDDFEDAYKIYNEFDSELFAKRIINGDTMYFTSLNITAGLQNPSYTVPGIVLESASPEYNASGYFITWKEKDFLCR